MTPAPAGKARSVSLLSLAVVASLSLWFVASAVLPEMLAESPVGETRQALLASGVQFGFVVGAFLSAVLGLPDRYDPRRLFAASAIAASLSNAALLVVPVGGDLAIAARVATGALLAGVYPVGMKIIVGWGVKDRGFLVGLLIGALTLGKAAPHVFALAGGGDWRATVAIASVVAVLGGLLGLAIGLGPHHARAPRFDYGALRLAWRDRRIRLAFAGYFGHMWELYAMWSWAAAALTAAYAMSLDGVAAAQWARTTAFAAIGLGGVASVVAGLAADRWGKAEVAMLALGVSCLAGLAAGLTFGGPAWLFALVVLIWGAAIAPDSAQFSALVADFAPPDQAGSLLALQTSIGFALTIVTVQATPALAEAVGWPVVLATLAIGPVLGFMAMARLRTLLRVAEGEAGGGDPLQQEK